MKKIPTHEKIDLPEGEWRSDTRISYGRSELFDVRTVAPALAFFIHGFLSSAALLGAVRSTKDCSPKDGCGSSWCQKATLVKSSAPVLKGALPGVHMPADRGCELGCDKGPTNTKAPSFLKRLLDLAHPRLVCGSPHADSSTTAPKSALVSPFQPWPNSSMARAD